MKEKILKLIKEHPVTTIILLLYIIRIFQMYFTERPLPNITQLLILVIGGSSMIVGISVLFNVVLKNKPHDKIKEPSNSKPTNIPKVSYHKMFNVAGVTYNCSLDEDMKRQEVLNYCKKRDKLHLKYHEYKGSPAFLVVLDKNNLDIGSVPANLVQTILKYKERNTKIEFVEISSFNPSDSKKEINYAKVRFLVYKD